MPSQDSTRWWYGAEAAVGLAVIAMPLCLGGAPWWTSVVLLGLGAAALGCWLVGAWRHRRRVTWHPMLVLPLLLSVVALTTLIPVPPGLLAVLSPSGAELREFALVPLGLDGARALSLDPPSTWRALVRTLGLGSLLFTSLQLGRLDRPRRRLLGVVGLSGALVSVVGLGHLLAGAEALFGVWRFFATVPLLSFFGNTNHLAGFLAFSATVALALALDARSREQSLAWSAAALGSGLGVFLSLSRGGVASFLLSWGVLGALALARRQGGVRAVLPWVAIGATTLFALALASEQLVERLLSVSTLERLQKTKLDLWPMFWRGALEHGRVGMGLGAFELGFGRWQTEQADVTFTHPENLVLQWLSEVGVPLTIVLTVGVAVVTRRLIAGAREGTLELVLLVALGGALVHDLFDFALELNALATAFVVVLGLTARAPSSDAASRWSVRRGWFLAPATVTVLGLVGVARGAPPHTVVEARVAQSSRDDDPATFRRELVSAIDRHPASWPLYAHAAARASTDGSARESLAWVNRVLFLRPGDARAHTSAGRALLRLGQDTQALLEFKLAWRLGDSSSFDEGLLVAARLQAFDRLLEPERGPLSRAWNRYLALGRAADAEALLRTVLELPPSEAVETEARELEVWQAAGRGEAKQALRLLRALPDEARSGAEVVALEARLLAQTGSVEEGIARLDSVARKRPGELSVALALVELLAAERRGGEARAVLERLRPFQAGPQARSQLFQREAELWALDERWPRALDALQSAARIEPNRPDLRYRMAGIYERMGSLHAALDEVRRGRLLDTPDGARAQDAWVSRLESQLATTGE